MNCVIWVVRYAVEHHYSESPMTSAKEITKKDNNQQFLQSINPANIPCIARVSGTTAESMFNSKSMKQFRNINRPSGVLLSIGEMPRPLVRQNTALCLKWSAERWTTQSGQTEQVAVSFFVSTLHQLLRMLIQNSFSSLLQYIYIYCWECSYRTLSLACRNPDNTETVCKTGTACWKSTEITYTHALSSLPLRRTNVLWGATGSHHPLIAIPVTMPTLVPSCPATVSASLPVRK